MDGDVDFLREALRVLVDAIMDAEVSAQIGAEHGERSPAGHLPQRLLHPHLGHPGRHHRAQYQWSCIFPSCGKAATSPACWNRGGAASRLFGSRESKWELRRPAPETWTTAGYKGPTSFARPGQRCAGPCILHTPGRAINEAPPLPSALRRRTAPNLAMCRRRHEPSASPAAQQDKDHAKEQGPPNSESAGARPVQT